MLNNPFYAKGLRFSCTRCSSCCRLEPGYVFLSRQDLEIMSAATGMDSRAFMAAWCRWVPSPGGLYRLSLREKPNFDCVFWRNGALPGQGGCSLYAARPLQCRTYPFWPSNLASEREWNAEKRRCPGVGKGECHGFEEIEAELRAQIENPVLSRDGSAG